MRIFKAKHIYNSEVLAKIIFTIERDSIETEILPINVNEAIEQCLKQLGYKFTEPKLQKNDIVTNNGKIVTISKEKDKIITAEIHQTYIEIVLRSFNMQLEEIL